MAAKGTENNVVETEKTSAEDVKVPHQKDKPVLEVIEGDNENPTLVEKAKGLLRNKKFIAGVSSVVLIAVGVVVVRNRNEDVSEDEVVTD